MPRTRSSGQGPFVFIHRDDLSNLPSDARTFEVDLHGGFAEDSREEHGEIYYGMPNCGILRVDEDLGRQEIISLPGDLEPLNFHSTTFGQFDGEYRLILPANNNEKVVILDLDGGVEFVLPRPVFEEYQDREAPYNPTDTVLVDDQLYIADGYGSNYISSYDLPKREWSSIFGGKTEDPDQHGRFGTAHGINRHPVHGHLDIADRPHSRIQSHHPDGRFLRSHKLPAGAFLCGINYTEYQEWLYGVIGCLHDPDEDRPAPVYIIDAESYELVSTIRPKEELGVEPAQHIHNVIFHRYQDRLFLICQSWNPGCYFVLEQVPSGTTPNPDAAI